MVPDWYHGIKSSHFNWYYQCVTLNTGEQMTSQLQGNVLTISGCSDPGITNTTAQITSALPSSQYTTAHASYFDMMCLDGYHFNRQMYAYFDNGKFFLNIWNAKFINASHLMRNVSLERHCKGSDLIKISFYVCAGNTSGPGRMLPLFATRFDIGKQVSASDSVISVLNAFILSAVGCLGYIVGLSRFF